MNSGCCSIGWSSSSLFDHIGFRSNGGTGIRVYPKTKFRKKKSIFTTMSLSSSSDPLLVQAANGEPVIRPPAWMMRQTGRYMAVYRKLAEKYPSFRERSETTDLIVEISLQHWNAFRPDGVIIFSNILTPLPAFGVPFDIEEVKGLVIQSPINSEEGLKMLHPIDLSKLQFVGDSLRILRQEEIRCHSHQKCEAASLLMHDHNLGVNEKSSTEVILRNKDCKSAPFKHVISAASETTVHDWLKFSMFFWFLTLQDSQQALAASMIANGLQSIPFLGDLGDISTGFASAFLLIFFSELGDKTFFIAALLAARNSGAIVFVGTFGALAAMTIISVVLGRTFHYIDDLLPFRFGEMDLPIDDIAAVCLLVYFGLSTLIEASSSDGLKTEEEQKEAELAVSEFSGNGAGILAAAGTVISTFLLVFVAEWGDKSFFSTIALAAASSPLGVIGGALAGHAVATLLAVLGGSLLGTFLSEKVIAYVGGSLFLVFAAVTLVEIIS